MDTNEQALVQVSAAPLAAPSAAVAGLVAASIAPNTKRSYEGGGRSPRCGRVVQSPLRDSVTVLVTLTEHKLCCRTERLVNHTQPSNVTEGYAVDWTVEQLRKPAHLMNPDRSANEASSAVAERSLPIA